MALILVFLLASAGGFQESEVSLFNVPTPIEKCMEPISAQYHVSGRINPFYLRGDFDGDGRLDHAVLVTGQSDDRSIVVCRAASRAPEIIADKSLPVNMAGRAFDAWMVFPKAPVGRGVETGPPPKLLGDALLIMWSESASGLLYWNGQKFRWYHQGD